MRCSCDDFIQGLNPANNEVGIPWGILGVMVFGLVVGPTVLLAVAAALAIVQMVLTVVFTVAILVALGMFAFRAAAVIDDRRYPGVEVAEPVRRAQITGKENAQLMSGDTRLVAARLPRATREGIRRR